MRRGVSRQVSDTPDLLGVSNGVVLESNNGRPPVSNVRTMSQTRSQNAKDTPGAEMKRDLRTGIELSSGITIDREDD